MAITIRAERLPPPRNAEWIIREGGEWDDTLRSFMKKRIWGKRSDFVQDVPHYVAIHADDVEPLV
jgi:hypothetical protein